MFTRWTSKIEIIVYITDLTPWTLSMGFLLANHPKFEENEEVTHQE
jgi:hypothetical protein